MPMGLLLGRGTKPSAARATSIVPSVLRTAYRARALPSQGQRAAATAVEASCQLLGAASVRRSVSHHMQSNQEIEPGSWLAQQTRSSELLLVGRLKQPAHPARGGADAVHEALVVLALGILGPARAALVMVHADGRAHLPRQEDTKSRAEITWGVRGGVRGELGRATGRARLLRWSLARRW